MKDFVYAYILVTQANPAIHYTGITRNLEQRLLLIGLLVAIGPW